jgi:hypothetical protein
MDVLSYKKIRKDMLAFNVVLIKPLVYVSIDFKWCILTYHHASWYNFHNCMQPLLCMIGEVQNKFNQGILFLPRIDHNK